MRCVILMLVALGALGSPAWGQGVPEKYKPAIKKGVAWLVKQQKADGSWPVEGQQTEVTATAFAGLALLADGSTTSKGAYAEGLAKAADWMIDSCKKAGEYDGLLGNRESAPAGQYMFAHGHGMLFLASVYAAEDQSAGGKDLKDLIHRQRRKEIEKVLKRAGEFSAKAQASSGGWFFTSTKEGHDQDIALATLCQLQGLRAVQQAGIAVPKETMKKAFAYLDKNTGPGGGLSYRSGPEPSERPAETVAAIAGAYAPDEYNNALVKKWLKFSEQSIPLPGRFGQYQTSDFLHGALVMHGLGDKGYAKLFGKANERMRWTTYRELCFDDLLGSQRQDGTWPAAAEKASTVYSTAVMLIILQLDNEAVPIFRAKKDR